jgi:hypothetical protein
MRSLKEPGKKDRAEKAVLVLFVSPRASFTFCTHRRSEYFSLSSIPGIIYFPAQHNWQQPQQTANGEPSYFH